jgi:regulator of protease activity HflC (stomatin/prohibitin superfamily)
MELINNISQLFSTLFCWWYTVSPWEQAIHIRRGKLKAIRQGGLYFKIPFIDVVYVQTTRLRMIDGSMQTLTSKDGVTITIKCSFGYAIKDINKIYETLYHQDMTLGSLIQGTIGEIIRTTDSKEITPKKIEQEVLKIVDANKYGLKDCLIRITTFAIVKTFRLIQDSSGLYENTIMTPIK